MPTDYAIKDGRTVFDATTYTGNGASSRSITNAGGFKPDLVWVKDRTNAYSHNLYDSVRGAGGAYNLRSDTTSAEGAGGSVYGYVSAFNSNGFSGAAGTDPTGPLAWINQNSDAYVAWQWQAGQGTTSSNTSGSITSTVSVNATAGFSVVTYTGTGASNATVGHGLGVAPQLVIVKRRNSTGDWCVWNLSAAATYGSDRILFLNTNDAATAAASVFNSSSPTSSIINLGTNPAVNGSGGTYVAYCWSEIAGFSKFGNYTGNGSADGPFVYTGFKPKYVLLKNITTAGYSWIVLDTSRNTYNVANSILLPNDSGAEDSSSNRIDFLSNGFKIRLSGGWGNNSGDTYIYAAFAENPFKYANAR